MKKCKCYYNMYMNQCNWKDMLLFKICLCAMGMMIGLKVPKEKKKCIFRTVSIIFIGSYIPLMTKLMKIVMQK